MKVLSDNWSAYKNPLLWIFGEAILGVFFYELATYMPDFVKIIVCGAAIIIWYDYRYFQKRTGGIYTGPLLLLPLIIALLCFAVWRLHQPANREPSGRHDKLSAPEPMR